MKILRKHHSITYTTVLLVMLTISSCRKNLLDVKDTIAISYDDAFNTPARVLAQVNDMYAKIKVNYFYAGRYQVDMDIRGEEFIINKPNTFTGSEVWTENLNSTSAPVTGVWSAAYTAINSANVFLQGLNDNQSKIDPTLFTQYAAEAKFIRALCYFDLVQIYAHPYVADNGASPGLPLRLKAETGLGDILLARSTVAQVYDQVISDLNDAEAGLPATYSSALLNVTRAHKNAAIALKMRVYLAKGDYASVVTEAAKIVSDTAPYQAPTGVNNKLETNIATVFGGSYTGPEAIFFLPFTTADAQATQVAPAYYYSPTTGNGEYYLNPSGILANPAFSSASDARSAFILSNGGNKWLVKFKGSSPYTEYLPVVRYADVLLMYAEALAHIGDPVSLAKAVDLLNAVRHRSAPAYVFAPADISGSSAIISTILTERRIELLGEGFRGPDLLRTLQTIPAKSGPAGVAPLVLPSASNYIWPISGDELSTNTLCTPNL